MPGHSNFCATPETRGTHFPVNINNNDAGSAADPASPDHWFLISAVVPTAVDHCRLTNMAGCAAEPFQPTPPHRNDRVLQRETRTDN